MDPIIETKGLGFAYRSGGQSLTILKDINLKINAGELVALQGPSGSGKSTLFYLLGGLLRQSSGQIAIAGRDLKSLSSNALAVFRSVNIGFVFQQFHLLPRASVLENILLPMRYTDVPRAPVKERALQLAQELGLGERLSHQPNHLSGGQQQRVAIARALLLNVNLILADEPTGNLDSKSGKQVLETLFELHRQGKTVVIVTHDPEVASKCHRRILLKDGMIVEDVSDAEAVAGKSSTTNAHSVPGLKTSVQKAPDGPGLLAELFLAVPSAFANLTRNKAKSFFTMLGVILGTAAVLAVITLGEFSKSRILEGYEALGVNKITLYGNQNWRNTKPEPGAVPFNGFEWSRDFEPLVKIFPEIKQMSPVMTSWQSSVIYGGRTVDDKSIKVIGVNHEYLEIVNGSIKEGRGFSPYHIDGRDPVCVIGGDIAKELAVSPTIIGAIISVTLNQNATFPCRVIGVKSPQTSNSEWVQPNKEILIPFTYFQVLGDSWASRMRNVSLKISDTASVEEAGKKLKKFFELKYGNSGEFRVDNDSTLVAQMKRFLGIFSILLFGIAALSLLVGGIGINNMMMVSITERLREIGLRKAVGATNRSIRTQVLVESSILCGVAGAIGVAGGFAACGGLMYAATKLIPNIKFEWVFNEWALIVSVTSVVVTGILSGIVPAFKAEKLQVIEALRSE